MSVVSFLSYYCDNVLNLNVCKSTIYCQLSMCSTARRSSTRLSRVCSTNVEVCKSNHSKFTCIENKECLVETGLCINILAWRRTMNLGTHQNEPTGSRSRVGYLDDLTRNCLKIRSTLPNEILTFICNSRWPKTFLPNFQAKFLGRTMGFNFWL